MAETFTNQRIPQIKIIMKKSTVYLIYTITALAVVLFIAWYKDLWWILLLLISYNVLRQLYVLYRGVKAYENSPMRKFDDLFGTKIFG